MKYCLIGLDVPEMEFDTRKEAVNYWNTHSGYEFIVPVPVVK